MTKVLTLTLTQGNALLQDCFTIQIPDKIEGIGAWNGDMRATIAKNIRQLKKALTEVSPIFKAEKMLHFGPLEAYALEQRQPDPKKKEQEVDQTGEIIKTRYVVKPEARLSTVEVSLNGAAWNGLFAILLLRAHPGPLHLNNQEFSLTFSPGRQDEILWPVAEQMGVDRDIEKKIGLGKTSGLEVRTNDEVEAEAQKDAEKKAKAEGNGEKKAILQKVE